MPQRVILGVSGGIAAYKAVEVCRRLVDAGLHVVPVLTPSATRFVTPLTFSAVASEPAQTELWNAPVPIPHTRLGQRADLIVIAPATADILARLACGLADDLLSATALATRAPVLVCPAMHTEMWEHPAVQENLATLRRRGVEVVDPDVGALAAGDVGAGRLADPQVIVERVLSLLERHRARPQSSGPSRAGSGASGAPHRDTGRDLRGRRVVVTAGGTREPIDPVRFLSNRSSGKQGHALARTAARRGAAVTLVTAAPFAPADEGIHVLAVETAEEMARATLPAAEQAEVIVMAAAVADYRPKRAAPSKLTRSERVPELELEPTPDILRALVERRRPGQVIVGFAAETGDALGKGMEKFARKGVDLLVVNDVMVAGAGFDHDTNQVALISAAGIEQLPLQTKDAVADAVWDRVVELLAAGDPVPPSAPTDEDPVHGAHPGAVRLGTEHARNAYLGQSIEPEDHR